MGARLVGLALQPCWGHLDTAARIVLLAMALTARDTATQAAPADLYWGGHDYLATTLTGRPLDDDGRADEAGLQQVKRAIRKLRAAGAIEIVESGRRGRSAVYRLRVTAPNQDMLPVDNLIQLTNKGGHHVTPKVGTK